MDLLVFRPVCLPDVGESFVDQNGHVYGEQRHQPMIMINTVLLHCCLAPCKSVPNYGPLTEPKIYIVKFGRTAISTLNGRISETKRDFLDPLVPKFSYDRGLSPTLS